MTKLKQSPDTSGLCGLGNLSDKSEIRFIRGNFHSFVIFGPDILSDIFDYPLYLSPIYSSFTVYRHRKLVIMNLRYNELFFTLPQGSL